METNESNEFFVISEAARFLGVATATMRIYADKQMIACSRTPGGVRVFRRVDLEAFQKLLRPGPGRPKSTAE